MSAPLPTFPFAGEADAAQLQELEQLIKEHLHLEDEWNKRNARIEKLTQSAVRSQSEIEIEEENMTNKLLKKLDDAKRNKSSIEERLKREVAEKAEVTSQVAMVQANLVDIENQIETEQNCILHKLQRDLLEVSAKKAQMQKALHVERGEYLAIMRQALDKIIADEGVAEPASPTGGEPTSAMPTAAAASASPSSASSASVLSLQHELNTLINDHFASEAAMAEDDMACGMLSQMLNRVHHEVAIERDRLLMMEGDLKRAQADVAIAERQSEMEMGSVAGGAGGSAHHHHHEHPLHLSGGGGGGGGRDTATASVASDFDGANAFHADDTSTTCSSQFFNEPSLALSSNNAAEALSAINNNSNIHHRHLSSSSGMGMGFGATVVPTPTRPHQQAALGAAAAANANSLSNAPSPAASSSTALLQQPQQQQTMMRQSMRSSSVSSVNSTCSSVTALRNHTHQVLSNALGGRGTPM